MKEIIKNALILFTITLISGVLLAFCFSITDEPRAAQQLIKRDQALTSVINDATFEELEGLDFTDTPQISSIFKAIKDNQTVGYAFKVASNEGYSGLIELVVGISIEGKITGIDIIKQSETPGLGAKADENEFKSQFADKIVSPLTVIKAKAAGEQEIAAISGATITSKAVTNAVNEAVNYFNSELKEGK